MITLHHQNELGLDTIPRRLSPLPTPFAGIMHYRGLLDVLLALTNCPGPIQLFLLLFLVPLLLSLNKGNRGMGEWHPPFNSVKIKVYNRAIVKSKIVRFERMCKGFLR